MRGLRARRSYKPWTRRSSWLLLTNDQPVTQHNAAAGAIGESGVVCYQDQCRAFALVERKQQLQHVPAILAVQVASRFVGQQDGRADHEGARQGTALLLATGKLDGIVVAAIRQSFAYLAGLL